MSEVDLIPSYLKHCSDGEKLNYIMYHNLDVTIHLDSESMYLIFNKITTNNRLDFDARLPNNQVSKNYLSDLGLDVNFP